MSEPARKPPRPIPDARLAHWDRDGAQVEWREGLEKVLKVAVEGSLTLPTGELVVCDLPQAANDPQATSPYEGPTIEVTPGAYDVVSASLDDEDGERALAFVGVRLRPERPVRWERAGNFDNDRARFASFVDAPGLEALRREPDFFDGFYFPWIEALLEANKKRTEWWSVRTLERARGTNAFVFVGNEEGTTLQVYRGLDDADRTCAVVVEMLPIRSEANPDADEGDAWWFLPGSPR